MFRERHELPVFGFGPEADSFPESVSSLSYGSEQGNLEATWGPREASNVVD